MKPHKILKTFPGSQHGNDYQVFNAGETAHLSDDLAAIVVRAGWAKPINENDPNDRETKVDEPDDEVKASKKRR